MTQLISLLTLILALLLPAPLAQTPPPGELETAAREFIELMVDGQYEAATAKFDTAMRQAVPTARLRAIWSEMEPRYGAFQDLGEAEIAESGEFTAVNVRARFARAEVNLRVVFNQEGLISGFFQYPIQLSGSPEPALLAMLAVTAFFTLLGPLALGWLARRRLGVSWKYFWIGAGIFLLFQVFLRMPLVSLVQTSLGPWIQSTTATTLLWIALLSLSAGLVEEIGRYIGYRWLMTGDPKTWKVGVMYGLGHGGIEAIILAGLSALSSLVVLLIWPSLQGSMPPAQSAPLAMQVATLLGSSPWLPLASLWERICAITLHVALSLLVLQVFRRGQIGWLWLAVAVHFLANFIVIGLVTLLNLTGTSSVLLSTGLLAVVAVLSAVVIYRLRE